MPGPAESDIRANPLADSTTSIGLRNGTACRSATIGSACRATLPIGRGRDTILTDAAMDKVVYGKETGSRVNG